MIKVSQLGVGFKLRNPNCPALYNYFTEDAMLKVIDFFSISFSTVVKIHVVFVQI